MSQTIPLASQSERVERLRAQLAGETAPASDATADDATLSPRARRAARTARGLALSPAANLLYGMTLRAAARSEQNEKLTDLEEQLVGLLRTTGSSDGEIAEFGRVFQKQATARGASALFTASVTERPLSEGYSFDDLAAELPALAPEITAQPNFRTVRVDTLTPGQPLDTPEAAEARGEYGGGVIVFLAENNLASSRATNPTPLDLRIEYNKFHCQKRTGDTVAGPSDEIYWVSGSGSDVSKTNYKSGEFGDMDDDDWGYWNPGTAHFFNGKIKNTLTGNIQCWEADDSTGGFLDELRRAAREISDWAFNTSERLEDQNEEYNGSSAFLSLIGLVARLVDALLGWFRNDDDLIEDITVAYSAAALYALSHRPIDNNGILFRGSNGRYVLYLKVVMPQGPAFSLRQHTLTGSTWSGTTTPPGLSSGSPAALESHDSRLHALFLAPGSTAIMHATLSGTSWSTPQPFGHGAASFHTPALASDGTKIHAVHVGGDGALHHNWWNGSSWTSPTKIRDFNAGYAPALAHHDGKLWLIHASPNGNLYYNTYENGTWSTATAMRFMASNTYRPALAKYAPSAASYNGALHVIYQTASGYLTPGVYRFALQGGGWTHQGTDAAWRLRSAPAIEAFDNKLYCVHPGLDGQLRSAHFDGSRWSSPTVISFAKSVDEPALATHAGKLHLMYRG
ncbi:hypothetical protein TPA0598_04_02860 [Streptomyces lydicamycinicus]|uniref:Uncharacterized protein n=1 Tax=Streptomyces lydicamycinicus TaxID=1546107 RepID=A0A0P4R698_9ACTN|nr:hypothetical protein [Streptomyces lydicamycinicus]GAO08650.1 hypothetical protein TPA0598_04_02860 [Streptomyces lydicamycinicus]